MGGSPGDDECCQQIMSFGPPPPWMQGFFPGMPHSPQGAASQQPAPQQHKPEAQMQTYSNPPKQPLVIQMQPPAGGQFAVQRPVYV